MQCPYCGNQHPDSAQFCPVTGKTLLVQQTTSKRFYVGLGVFSVLLMAMSLFMLLGGDGFPVNFAKQSDGIDMGNTASQVNVEPTSQPNSPTKRPTATAIGTATLPPAVTPEQFFASSDIKYAVISGEVFKVNMRKLPGYQNKINEIDVIVEVPTGSHVKVLGGPEVADGLNWWYVEWMNCKGWIAETTRTGKIILVFEK